MKTLAAGLALVALLLVSSAGANHAPAPTHVTLVGSLQSELGCPGDWDPACAASRLVYDSEDDVWQQAWGGSDKTVDVHLSWLRRKLGESAAEPRYLHTVRGVGVCLSAPG